MLSISACSWLAGIASSAVSELPSPFPAPWVLLSLPGHHPVLFPLRTRLHYCPAFAPPLQGLLRYYAGLRLLPAPLRPSPLPGLCRALGLAPHANRFDSLRSPLRGCLRQSISALLRFPGYPVSPSQPAPSDGERPPFSTLSFLPTSVSSRNEATYDPRTSPVSCPRKRARLVL